MFKIFLFISFSVSVLVDSIPLDDSGIEGYIIGGNATDISKVPYHVAMLVDNTYGCAGFILSPTHIVTASTCVIDRRASEVSVRAGSSFCNKGGIIVRAKNLYQHPKYEFRSKDYDVGIIELAVPLKFDNKTIKPIKLATKEPSTGSTVLVSGWGFVNYDLDEDELLQSVTFPIYNRTKCADDYKPLNETINQRMICGGTQDKKAFVGDQGGAIVYNGEAVGIVSFNMGELPSVMPGVHTNIAHPEITKFIKDITKV